MNPPSLKQVDTTQMEEAPEWFREVFLSQLNPFLRDVVNAFLSILAEKEERVVRVSTGASYGADTNPVFIAPQKVRQPQNVIVTKVVITSSATAAPVAAVQPFWRLTSKGEVEVRWFTGLDANTTYDIRLRMD